MNRLTNRLVSKCCEPFKLYTIDVRYEFVNQNKLMNWKLNDEKNTYYIQFDYNYITTENKINELENNRIVDSVTIISEDNLNVKSNEVIRHKYHSLKDATTINNYPKTIYYHRDYSSLIMLTDYVILKYIRESKPSKNIHPIKTLRKPIKPETIL